MPVSDPSRTISGFIVAAFCKGASVSSISCSITGLTACLMIFAPHRLQHVEHHVRVALRMIEIVVVLPGAYRSAVGVLRHVKHCVGVAEQIAPRLEQRD